MSLQIIVTNAGRAALVNAQHSGTLPVTIAAVGVSSTAVVPTQAAVTLPGEIKRIAGVGGTQVAADTIHITATDESTDAYSVRSVACYLADGTLFAIYGGNDVIVDKVAASIALLALDIQFADIAAANIAFGNANFLNPPASTTVQGVSELADDAEAQAMVDAVRALTPRGLGLVFTAAKILQKLIGADGAGSGLDADLLDGQQGAWYSDIPARLGFTPAKLADVTASIILARLLTVDGAGSGLDADLLDGLDSSAFAKLAGAAFTGGVSAPSLVASVQGGGSISLVPSDGTHTGYLELRRSDGVRQAYLGYMLALGAVAYVNDLNGGHAFNGGQLTRDGNRVWDAGNDGSGSGLDADLLDGFDSGAFAKLTGALFGGSGGKGGVRISPGDVIGSGQFEFYRPDGARIFYLYQPMTGPGAGSMVYGKENGGSHYFTGADLRHDGLLVWDAGNDGSGSGSDADMVDGWHADGLRDWNNLLNRPGAFPPSGFDQGLSDFGWQRLPSGLIMQWGGGAHQDNSGGQRINFPVAFPNQCFRIVVTNAAGGAPTAFHGSGNYDQGGATIYSSQAIGNPSQAGTAFHWIAFGR